MRRAGFARDGKSPAFCASQEAISAESFSRSLRNRVHGGPENTLSIEASHAQAPPFMNKAG
jgi:hypothetical protein